MTLTTLWSIATKILDISIVWLMFYFILKNVKNNIKMVLIVKGVILILIIKLISSVLDLYTVGLLLEYILSWGPIEYLKKNRIGALIVIERDISLQEYIDPATKIYADVSSPLLGTIFFPNNPLHDGGVIIQGDRITCAGSVFKTSMDPTLSKRLGTRHRAALGVAEETDAIALIVSEETGRISIAVDGNMKYNLTLEDFKNTLIDELKPKTEVFYDADDEESAGEENA